jgi:histidinol phosphatase-like enzyme
MLADQLVDETRSALNAAEELLDKLPPLSPDHETVRVVVVRLRQMNERARRSSDMTKRALTESRHTIQGARDLIDTIGRRVPARSARTPSATTGVSTGATSPRRNAVEGALPIFLDMDTVLLASHPGRYGPELAVQADIHEALNRLAEIEAHVVVLANPPADGSGHVMGTQHRLEVLRAGLGHTIDQVVVATCSHGENGHCECAKPGSGLIHSTIQEHGLARHAGWYVGGDQAGMLAGRTAGLRTIRIGPIGEDHLSAVHRPDHEARDLLDAANRILLESLAFD